MNYLFQFLLIVVLAALASAKVTVQGFMSRKYISTSQDSVWFNSLLFMVIGVLFVILFPMGELNGTIVFYASIVAFTNIAFQCCYAIALRSGPVSLTVLIGNFNILLTTSFSCLFMGDSLYATQLVAIGFLIVSMFLANESKPDEKKATRKWLILSLICMSCSATFGIGQKLFLATPQAQLPNAQPTELALSYFASGVFGFILYAFGAVKGKKSPLKFQKAVLGYAGAIGLLLCVYQRLNSYTMSVVEGSFHFPTYAGMQSLTMTLVGVVLFKDKLTRKQLIGVACGIISVILMNMRLGAPLF